MHLAGMGTHPPPSCMAVAGMRCAPLLRWHCQAAQPAPAPTSSLPPPTLLLLPHPPTTTTPSHHHHPAAPPPPRPPPPPRRILRLAAPLSISNLAGYAISMVVIAATGHLGEEPLSVVVLATSVFNVTGLSVLIGFSSAMETFCG